VIPTLKQLLEGFYPAQDSQFIQLMPENQPLPLNPNHTVLGDRPQSNMKIYFQARRLVFYFMACALLSTNKSPYIASSYQVASYHGL